MTNCEECGVLMTGLAGLCGDCEDAQEEVLSWDGFDDEEEDDDFCPVCNSNICNRDCDAFEEGYFQMKKLTIPNSIENLEAEIRRLRLSNDALTSENTRLKTQVSQLTSELPTDESTRKKAISGFIHKNKKLNESA